jgi:hypothetical protein
MVTKVTVITKFNMIAINRMRILTIAMVVLVTTVIPYRNIICASLSVSRTAIVTGLCK